MSIPFGPIYPYTFGTWVGVGFWWLLIGSVIVSIIITVKTKD